MGIEEVSVPSTPLCCEPRTALKIKSVLKKKTLGEMKNSLLGGEGHVDFLIFTVLTGNWEVS